MDAFVHRPALFVGMTTMFAILILVMHFTGIGSGKSPRPLWIAAGAWALGGLWEYVVMTRTPEANIRVDLLVLLPTLALLTVWALWKGFR